MSKTWLQDKANHRHQWHGNSKAPTAHCDFMFPLWLVLGELLFFSG